MASLSALPTAQEGKALFCWDLARVDFGQRKLLVASNAATRLCAITRMAAADWRHIDEAALRSIENAVGCAGLETARYLELAGGIGLSETHGMRALGCMNDLSRMLDPPASTWARSCSGERWSCSTAGSFRNASATRATAFPPSASQRTCGRWLIEQDSGYLRRA